MQCRLPRPLQHHRVPDNEPACTDSLSDEEEWAMIPSCDPDGFLLTTEILGDDDYPESPASLEGDTRENHETIIPTVLIVSHFYDKHLLWIHYLHWLSQMDLSFRRKVISKWSDALCAVIPTEAFICSSQGKTPMSI